MRYVVLCAAALVVAMPAWSATISDNEAAEHIGETATVCGMVASVYFASRSRARPTFLDFGADYPRESFTAVVFGDDRRSFGDLGNLRGYKVCVTGPIETYRGRPEIILHQRSQLQRR